MTTAPPRRALAVVALVAGCGAVTGCGSSRCVADKDCPPSQRCVQDPPNATVCQAPAWPSCSGTCPGAEGVSFHWGFASTCPSVCRAVCDPADGGAQTCEGGSCQARLAIKSVGDNYDAVSVMSVSACVP